MSAYRRQERAAGTSARITGLTGAAHRLSSCGKYAAAKERLLEAARILRYQGKLRRLERAVVWNELGMICKYQGRYCSAYQYYRQALRSSVDLAGKRRDQLVADLYHNLAGLEHSKGRYASAEKLARKGLDLRLKAISSRSLAVAADLSALSAILSALHRYDESEQLCRRALRIFRREYGAAHPEIATVCNNLGAICQQTGRPERAVEYYSSALRMKIKELGNSHPDLVPTMNNLATLHHSRGRLTVAMRWFREALQLAEQSLGRSHPVTGLLRRNLSQAVVENSEGRGRKTSELSCRREYGSV